MSSALRGKPKTRTRPLFWDLRRRETVGPLINRSPKLIIREGRWKLLMQADGTGVELYDIVANSLEVDNLANEHPEKVRKLKRRLLEWKKNPAASF